MISKIEKIIKEVVGEDLKFIVTASEKPEFGHYSTNVAFLVRENPRELAEKINNAGKDFFEKVEVAGKFINFWIMKNILLENLKKVYKIKKFYSSDEKRKQKVNLEFISANPTGPLTMANGRGGFIGDVLANVLEFVGYKVTREYYINDAGNQIKLLGESILAESENIQKKEGHYQGDYIKDLAESLKKEIQKGKNPEELGRLAANILLKKIRASVKEAGISFKVWYSEFKNLRGGKGLANKILEILEKKGLVIEKDGAKWLKSSEIADEKDRVLVKSDGQPTYFLVDTAYHYDKFIKRKYDKAINIWGADHHGYIARLKSGIKSLDINPDKLKIIITQLVRLTEGGKEVRMSKRKGEFITLDEIIKEVGKDAVRFFFLMNTPDHHMDFDLALAKERSLKNPVYYVQYAYVRCNSIIKKVGAKGKINNLKLLNNESEFNLVKELVKLPDVILQSAEDCQINRLARYAMEIARALHNFYEKERVIGEKKEIMEARLALVSATKIILEKLFKILGISAPERM